MTDLSNDDKLALNRVEREAATGKVQDAVRDLHTWTSTVEPARQQAAVQELTRSGVLPVLGLEALKEEVHQSKKDATQDRVSDLAYMSSGSPVQQAMFQAAHDNFSTYDAVSSLPKHGILGFGDQYENEATINAQQAQIAKDNKYTDAAAALTANNGALFDQFAGVEPGKRTADSTITGESINRYLRDVDGNPNDRALARQLKAAMNDGSLIAGEDGITQASLASYMKLHPQAPADLSATTPPAAGADQAAGGGADHGAGDAPPAGDGKVQMQTHGFSSLWSMAYNQVVGHPYKKGDHWNTDKNQQILALTKLLQTAHPGALHSGKDETIEVQWPPPAAS
jgi:hypothetical protein